MDEWRRYVVSAPQGAACGGAAGTTGFTRGDSMGELHIAAAYEAVLFYSDFTFAPIEASTARIASKIAGHYRMKVMDSLVIASLFESGATAFITADKYLKKIKEIDVLLIS